MHSPRQEASVQMPLQPLAYTLTQAAAVAGRNKKQIYKDIATGALRSYKHGRCRMVLAADLERHLTRLAREGGA